MPNPVYNYVLKMILIGNSSVGKSNILSQFTDKYFSISSDTTIGVEFATKLISRNNVVYKLQIWDTAGQEAFRSITRNYYRNSLGCLVIYDITQRDTFTAIPSWIDEIKNISEENVTIILIGNKLDLAADNENDVTNEDNDYYFNKQQANNNNTHKITKKIKREVSTQEGKELADKYGFAFFETSALTAHNIDNCFLNIIDQINEKINNKTLKLINMRTNNTVSSLVTSGDTNIDNVVQLDNSENSHQDVNLNNKWTCAC
jgi:Ras-related protein Rab-2A